MKTIPASLKSHHAWITIHTLPVLFFNFITVFEAFLFLPFAQIRVVRIIKKIKNDGQESFLLSCQIFLSLPDDLVTDGGTVKICFA